jgi:thymidylate synthase (FAD)
MTQVSLVWVTPQAEEKIAYMARVSNPANQNNPQTASKLLKYLVKNKHWSPFEMVNVCMEIETTRDIARQILRHRSFSFQEFSQRYATAEAFETRECRKQDMVNRQNSIALDVYGDENDRYLATWWDGVQQRLTKEAEFLYEAALNKGIAKEVARALLPEGLTGSKLYMNGTLRSWIHYIEIRCDKATQKEHREVAEQCRDIIFEYFPSLEEVLNGA